MTNQERTALAVSICNQWIDITKLEAENEEKLYLLMREIASKAVLFVYIVEEQVEMREIKNNHSAFENALEGNINRFDPQSYMMWSDFLYIMESELERKLTVHESKKASEKWAGHFSDAP